MACANDSPWALAHALAFLRRTLTRFPFSRLVSHVYPLERITDGFREADWMQRQGGPAPVARATVTLA